MLGIKRLAHTRTLQFRNYVISSSKFDDGNRRVEKNRLRRLTGVRRRSSFYSCDVNSGENAFSVKRFMSHRAILLLWLPFSF